MRSIQTIIVFIILLCGTAMAGSGLWEASVIHTDDKQITLRWDPTISECPMGYTCGYELEMRSLEQSSYVEKFTVIGFATDSKTVAYKKSGHYKFYIRSYRTTAQGQTEYSEWADSYANGIIMIGVPEPAQRPWLLYWRLPPPESGTIN